MVVTQRIGRRSAHLPSLERLEPRRLLSVEWMSTDAGASITDNAAMFDQFMPIASESANIGFDDLADNLEAGAFISSHGVLLSPAAIREVQGVYAEGESFIETLDGYDGTNKADGDSLLLIWPNHASGFTIFFTQPVASVGSFLATGAEGEIETLSVEVFDASGTSLSAHSASVSLFQNAENREGYWAVKSDTASISKVSILNDNPIDFGNVLMVDDLRWSRRPSGILAGDADYNGTVEFGDFLILANNFGRNNAVVFGEGDFNEDGQVSFGDFLILAENFGRTSE